MTIEVRPSNGRWVATTRPFSVEEYKVLRIEEIW
jgi:hypothetical protein